VLEAILTKLPADLPVPVVVAQHMPALFTKSLAERLDQHCAVSVVQADQNMPLNAGTVAIIQGGKHGRVVRGDNGRYTLQIGDEPRTALYKPSVDELMRSGTCAGETALGVVLTGMGEDGAIGAGEMHRAGGTLVAQEGSTCVVYGMPRALVTRNLAHAALPPDEIATLIASLCPTIRGRMAPAAFRKSA
jgi:two-component system chemotaxis response regulator CheB